MRALNSTSAFRHEHVADIDSTNAELLRRAQTQSVHGLALSADFQSAGRGQRGRTWRARRSDSVLLSVAWAFPKAQRIDGLSLAVGVAVSEAIDAIETSEPIAFACGRPVLKWPNDVLLATSTDDAHGVSLGKLGGILIETTPINAEQRIAVIGVGVNVATPDSAGSINTARLDAPRELPSAALLPRTSDKIQSIRAQLLDELLASLWVNLQAFSVHGFTAFRERWWQRRAYADLPVQVLAPDGSSHSGLMVDLTEQGALVVDGRGGRHTLVSGTVSLRPLTF